MTTVADLELHDEHFRLLVESVQDYAIFVMDPEGFIRSWNAGAQRIKGYRADEAIGMHFSRFYRADDRSWQRVLRAARDEGHVEEYGWRIRKDGSQFWASIVITALRDRAGRLIGFAKVTRDLTDRSYRTFVEATNAIVWTTDADGAPNADSPSWRAFTGQTEDQWRGRQGWDPVHPEDRPALEVEWPRARRERAIFEAELRLRRHDGVYVWMACRAVPLFAEDGSVREWFGVTSDISARKAAEHDEQRARMLLETTLRSIGDGVITTDAHAAVTFLNPVAERLTGWSSSDAGGKPLTEVFPIINEQTRRRVENPVERVLRDGVVVGLANHTVLVRKDGEETPIDDSAAPIMTDDGMEGVVLVFRDVSQEKLLSARRDFLARAGTELVGASDYRDALMKVAQLAVPRLADWCAIDIIDPKSEALSRLAVTHADPDKAAYAHELARRFPPQPDAPTGVPNVLRTGRSELHAEIQPELLERAVLEEEHRQILAKLDLRSAMLVPLTGRDRVFGVISLVHTGHRRYTEDDLAFAEDFARRAAMIVERRKLEEEAAQANRAKDEFLAMLGHELRNPLAPIRTALQLMALRGDPSTAREREVIERQVGHLVTLVDDLLDVSRITRAKITLEREPIEISAVIARALELASPLLEARRHQLELDVPRSGHAVEGDPARLAQVFANLLTNAAKYTDPGGRISIKARRDADDLVVTVTDTGVGISPEILPHVFDMFVQEPQTIARSQGGLGLGLNIARSLVRMHGGRIVAHSAGRGHGSTFTVRLPALARHADTPAVVERPPPGVRDGGHRVILVDDNADAVALLESALRTFGYDARYALDGPAALSLVEDFTPEIAVLDIGLPVMDGYELAQRLHDRFPALPLIALTGYGQEDDLDRSRTAGFRTHLVKPVDLDRLRAAIDELLGEAVHAGS